MEKLIEVYGILSTNKEGEGVKYLCLNSCPPRFLSWVLERAETLRDGIDSMFSEYGIDTSDIPKRPVRMIDVPGRNLTYVFLLECDYNDLSEFLKSQEEEILILLEKDNLTGEAKSWVSDLEKKIAMELEKRIP